MGPNPLNSCQPLRFISTQASCKEPCWTPRQHDTIKRQRVYASQMSRCFAKASRSSRPFSFVPTHRSCGSNRSTQPSKLSRLQLITNTLSKAAHPVSSQPSCISSEPFKTTKRQTTARLHRLKPQQAVFIVLTCTVRMYAEHTANKQETHAG